MRRILIFKNELDYARFIHLLSIYVIAILFFLFSKIPHGWWILLTSLVISTSIEPGLLVKRSFARIKGTLLGLILLLPLLYLLQLNYRLIPVAFILGFIGFNVSALNDKRYDIAVFFMTVSVVLFIAQANDVLSPEGPIEIIINRLVCTLIGIMIVVFADFYLFDSYGYSQKLYLSHQKNLVNFFMEVVNTLSDKSSQKSNSFLLIKKLRIQTNEQFKSITISAESLNADLKVSDQIKQQISIFQDTIWELRQVVFGLYFSQLTLKSQERSEIHLARYRQLIEQARSNFIQVR